MSTTHPEIETQPEVEQFAEQTANRQASRTVFLRFLAWLLLPPALLYLFCFFVVLIPTLRFERWGPTKWGPVLQFAFDAHTDADILIYGDSSAFLGIDPKLLNAGLDTTTVVLPNTIGSLPITGELALRRYLAHNRPPKLIVLYFTAWDLDYQHTAQSRVFFEGEEMLLRNGSAADILRFARQHPLELLAFPFRLNSTIGLHLLRTTLHHADREKQTSAALGHVNYTEPYPPLTSPCRLPQTFLEQTRDGSVRALITRYTTSETRVLVYLAPVPDCAGVATFLQRPVSETRLESPVVLPPSWFASDALFAHPEPSAVHAVSVHFEDFLRRHMTSAQQTAPPRDSATRGR